jgi:aspartate aminotransferase
MKQDRGADQIFDFSLGNPCLDPPAAFFEALKEEVNERKPGKHAYMENAGYPDTREAVATHLREKRELPFEARHILMTCGAAGGLNVVFKTLLDPGDEVIILAPYFAEYLFYVGHHGGEACIVDTRQDFSLDLQEIRKSISSRTKAILINSPNNPTGRMYDRESLQELGEILQDTEDRSGQSLYLISDEPYGTIVFDGKELPDLFSFFKNTILVNSYSKSLSIPGERLGYIAIHPEIEDQESLLSGLSFCNRTLGFVNAPAALQRIIRRIPGLHVDSNAYEKRRDLICKGLEGEGYRFVKPDGAFYVFPESPVPDDKAFVGALLEEGVLVVPGAGFGRTGHFRIAFCVEEKTIQDALPAFSRVFQRFC